MTLETSLWNETNLRLELSLFADVNPTNDDLTFNRLAMIRGGKAQGGYTGDFNAANDTFTITSAIPEPWSPGDRLVVHGSFDEFTVDTVTGGSGEILTLVEDVTSTATGVQVSDATGTFMVAYTFSQEAIVFLNATTRITVRGFDFAG